MKKVTVKVYNQVELVKDSQVVTKDGKPTRIKAEKGVNYEFFDHNIAHAPNHIVTKRVKNDLHVSFEREGKDVDLIIEDFYSNSDQALIGVAEDGEYYYYIPDTGEVADYVTQLEPLAVEGQALGGEHIASPLWVTLASGGNPFWLALGLIPFLLHDHDDSDDTVSASPVSNIDVAWGHAGETVTQKITANDSGKPKAGTVKIVEAPNGATISADGKSVKVPGEGTWRVNADDSISFEPSSSDVMDPTAIKYTVEYTDGSKSKPTEVEVQYTREDTQIGKIGAPIVVNVIKDEADDVPSTVKIVEVPSGATISSDGKTANVPGEGTWTVDTKTGSITYTPEKGFTGDPKPIKYTVEDDNGISSKPTAVTVKHNQYPISVNDYNQTDEDKAVTGNVLTGNNQITEKDYKQATDDNRGIHGTDNSVDKDNLSIRDFTVEGTTYKVGETADIADVGSITINKKGDYTFIPVKDFNGKVPQVEYTAIDGKGGEDPTTLDIVVTPVSDSPVTTPDHVTTPFKTPVTIDVIKNDTDPDGPIDPKTVKLMDPKTGDPVDEVKVPGEGTWTNHGDGKVTFTPDDQFSGTPTPVTYIIDDKDPLTPPSKPTPINVTVGVKGNDSPEAKDNNKTTAEDTPVKGNVIKEDGKDTDPNQDPLTVSDFTVDGTTYKAGKTADIPDVGKLIINKDGSYTFTPAKDFNGKVPAVDYTVTDGSLTDTAKLNIDVTPQNDPPIADDNAIDLKETETSNLGLVAPKDIDSDFVNDPKTSITVTGLPKDDKGNLIGKIKKADGTAIQEGDVLSVDELTKLTYTAPDDYKGQKIKPFTYIVKDENGATDEGTVTIKVDDLPRDKPTLVDDIQTGKTGKTVTVDVLKNDTDKQNDIDPTTVKIIDPKGNEVTTLKVPGEGEWSVDNTTGKISFTPETGFTKDPTPVTYTVTDKTGLKANPPATVKVDYPDLPTVKSTKPVSVSEEGLKHGLKDKKGSSDTTDSTHAEGVLKVTHADSVVFDNSQTNSIGNTQVSWNGLGTQKLTAYQDLNKNGSLDAGEEVLVASINDKGEYKIDLKSAISHKKPDIEDIVKVNLAVKADDKDPSTPSGKGNLSVIIEDDSPKAASEAADTPVPPIDVNLMLIVDVSGSMNKEYKNTNKTRLELTKEALQEAIEQYEQYGDIRVRLVYFSTSADAVGEKWVTASEALEQINGLIADGSTNYDAALSAAMDAFKDEGKLDTPKTINRSIFITDGEPNLNNGSVDQLKGSIDYTGRGDPDSGIQEKEEATWVQFIKDNDINSFAVSINKSGEMVPDQKAKELLDPIAYDAIGDDGKPKNTDGEIISPDALKETLLNGINIGIDEGNFIEQGSVGTGGFGADKGNLLKVSIDGQLYEYNKVTDKFSIKSSANYEVDEKENTVSISTKKGGKFTIDFDNASYEYQGSKEVLSDYTEVVKYLTIDNDGDRLEDSLTLNVHRYEARNDIVLTNQEGSTVHINHSTLSANDDINGKVKFNNINNVHNGKVSNNTDSIDYTFTKYVSDLGKNSSVINENPTDGPSNYKIDNSVTNMAQDLTDRSQFGVSNNATAPKNTKVIEFNGNITNDYNSYYKRVDGDKDWIKLSLKAGEKLTLDVDGGYGKGTSVDTKLSLYSFKDLSNPVAENDNSTKIDAGSNSTKDAYVTYTVKETGEYYVKVTSANVANSSPYGNGNYKLWVGIDDSNNIGKNTEGSFDYSITEDKLTDKANVSVKQLSGSTINGTTERETLIGRDNAEDILNAGAGNDVLDGGTGSDILKGQLGDDVLIYDSKDKLIDGGLGDDTLSLVNFTGKLDISMVKNIEKINLTDGIDQKISLTAKDVIDMTDSDNVLYINGDHSSKKHSTSGDTVNLSGFSKGTVDGEYTIYESNGAKVYIDNDINVIL